MFSQLKRYFADKLCCQMKVPSAYPSTKLEYFTKGQYLSVFFSVRSLRARHFYKSIGAIPFRTAFEANTNRVRRDRKWAASPIDSQIWALFMRRRDYRTQISWLLSECAFNSKRKYSIKVDLRLINACACKLLQINSSIRCTHARRRCCNDNASKHLSVIGENVFYVEIK